MDAVDQLERVSSLNAKQLAHLYHGPYESRVRLYPAKLGPNFSSPWRSRPSPSCSTRA